MNVGGAPTSVSAAAQAPTRAVPDVRLLPVLGTCWVAAAWATGVGPVASGVASVGCLLLGGFLGLAFTVRRPQLDPRRGDRGIRLVVSSVVLTTAASGLVLAAAAIETTQRRRGPLPGWTADRAVIYGWGRVLDDPQRVVAKRSGAFDAVRFTLRVRLEEVSARGFTTEAAAPVLVIGGTGWADVSAGQRVALSARLSPSEPGDDVVAFARAIGSPRQVVPGARVWQVADRLRVGLRLSCAGLPADPAGLLPSLVVGDTSLLSDALRADLRTAGLTHLTAVSGANVAIIAGAVLWTLTVAGVNRIVRVVLALTVVAGFVVVARPEPSVLRAAVMGGVALVGLASSRRPRGLPALGAGGTALLVADPWLSRSAGFALSCAATAALLLLAPVWTRQLARWMPLPVAAAIAVPAAAQAACGPIVVLLAPAVSVVAIPANLLAGPAVAPATIAGVLAAVVSPISPDLARLFARAGTWATSWIVEVAQTAAGFPLAELPWPSGVGGALLLAAVTSLLVLGTLHRRRRHDETGSGGRSARVRRPGRGRRAKRRPMLPVLLALGLAASMGWWFGPRLTLPGPLRGDGRAWPPGGWVVVQCDVGQGAATVVRSGPDRAVLVDVGPDADLMNRCLERLDVRHLDLIVLTHYHVDHVGGLAGALKGRDARQVLVSPLAQPRAQEAAVRRAVASAGIPMSTGLAGESGQTVATPWSARWRLLAPVDPPAHAPDEQGEGTAVNDASLVPAVEVTGPHGVLRVVGLGDLETAGQEGLRRRLESGAFDAGGPVDVLVVAHHGSARQVPRLCRLLAPRVAVIGVGAGNDHGHPAPSALRMLRDCGPVVYRTDLSGGVALELIREGDLVAVTERRHGDRR